MYQELFEQLCCTKKLSSISLPGIHCRRMIIFQRKYFFLSYSILFCFQTSNLMNNFTSHHHTQRCVPALATKQTAPDIFRIAFIIVCVYAVSFTLAPEWISHVSSMSLIRYYRFCVTLFLSTERVCTFLLLDDPLFHHGKPIMIRSNGGRSPPAK